MSEQKKIDSFDRMAPARYMVVKIGRVYVSASMNHKIYFPDVGLEHDQIQCVRYLPTVTGVQWRLVDFRKALRLRYFPLGTMCQHWTGSPLQTIVGEIGHDPIGANMVDMCGEHYRLPGTALHATGNFVKCIIDFHNEPKWIESNRIGHYAKKRTEPFAGKLSKCVPYTCDANIHVLAADFKLGFSIPEAQVDDFELDCPPEAVIHDATYPGVVGTVRVGSSCVVRCKNGKTAHPGNPASFAMSRSYDRRDVRNYKLSCMQSHDGYAIWSRIYTLSPYFLI